MKFYIYETETSKIVEVVEVEDNGQPTDIIMLEYDLDKYAGTFTPAFGTIDGLVW